MSGWRGDRGIRIEVVRVDEGAWTLNGEVVPGLDECLDVDLAFTPATNMLQIRRLGLAVGERGQAPAAWLDASTASLERLDQRYERRSAASYRYEAPRFGYEATLEVRPDGFVRVYPGLWEMET